MSKSVLESVKNVRAFPLSNNRVLFVTLSKKSGILRIHYDGIFIRFASQELTSEENHKFGLSDDKNSSIGRLKKYGRLLTDCNDDAILLNCLVLPGESVISCPEIFIFPETYQFSPSSWQLTTFTPICPIVWYWELQVRVCPERVANLGVGLLPPLNSILKSCESKVDE